MNNSHAIVSPQATHDIKPAEFIRPCANEFAPTTRGQWLSEWLLPVALNFVPEANERAIVDAALVADHDSDVICFQEIWLHAFVIKITRQKNLQHSYSIFVSFDLRINAFQKTFQFFFEACLCNGSMPFYLEICCPG